MAGLLQKTLAEVAKHRERIGAKSQKEMASKKKAKKKKAPVNRNKPGPVHKTSKKKADAQKEALRKKIAKKVADAKKKKVK